MKSGRSPFYKRSRSFDLALYEPWKSESPCNFKRSGSVFGFELITNVNKVTL